MTDTDTGNICLHDNGGVLDVYTLSGVCLVSFVVCLGTSFVECRGCAVPGTARCVEPWSKTDL